MSRNGGRGPEASWLAARKRDLAAARHYRPTQIASRAANRVRRLLASARPGPLRRALGELEATPPPRRDLACPAALRAHVLDPEVVPPDTAADLLAGRFRFLDAERTYGNAVQWTERGPGAPAHLWRMHLHYHRFPLEAVAGALRTPSRAGALLERAAELLLDWRRACPAGDRAGFQDAWNSYSVSTRILHGWAARRLLAAVPGHAAERLAAILDGRGAADAAFLSRWLEHDLGGNHLLRNAVALVAAGRWFAGPHGDAWALLGAGLLDRELGRQILSDGFHEERSPMYHALLVEDLLGAGVPGTEAGRQRLARLLGALVPVLHPDGDIALFNDATPGFASPPRALLRLAQGLGVDPLPGGPDLPDAGWFRFEDGADLLLFDAGPLGPDHLPAHAHCDALSFELSLDGRRVVTDTAVDRYEAGPDRDFQRSVAAHATLQVDGMDQAEPFGSFRMGRRPRVRGRRLDARAAEGEHDGFLPAGIHRRTLRWEGGGRVSWVDVLEGPAEVPVTVRLGMVPGTDVALGEGGARAAVPGGPVLRWSTPEGVVRVEQGWACEGFGRRRPRPVLCWRGMAGRGRALPFTLARLR